MLVANPQDFVLIKMRLKILNYLHVSLTMKLSHTDLPNHMWPEMLRKYEESSLL